MSRALAVIGLAILALVVTQPLEKIGRGFYDAGMPRMAGWLLPGQVWRGATFYAEGRFAEAAVAFNGAPSDTASYDEGTALARADRLAESIEALNDALYRDPNDQDARYNLALVETLQAKRERTPLDANGAANATASKQKRGGEAPTDAENDVNSTGMGAAGDRDSGRQADSPGEAQISRLVHSQQSRLDASQGEARGSIGDAEGLGRKGDTSAKIAKSFDQAIKLPKKSFAQQAVQPSIQWLQTIPDDPGKFLRFKLAAEHTGRTERGVAAPAGTDQW